MHLTHLAYLKGGGCNIGMHYPAGIFTKGGLQHRNALYPSGILERRGGAAT